MEEQISLSVQLGGRIYKLKVNKTEEEIFQEAAKLIADRMKVYAQSFASQDKQDLLAMIALEFGVMQLKNSRAHKKEIEEITKNLTSLDDLLSDNQLQLF